LKKMSDILAS